MMLTMPERELSVASPENILLHLPAEEEAQVRQIYAELEARGFPPQQQTPHITVTFAPHMPEEPIALASELLPSLIPARFQRVGTVVFGTKRKQTVAWLLETDDELEIAARRISACNPVGRGPRWTPHLTMGLRLPREIVPDYIRALDEIASARMKELTGARAALWRPRLGHLTILAGEGFGSREVRVTGKLICATPAEAEIVEHHLPRHVELTRAEPGCLHFEVLPTAGGLVWNVHEHFADEVAFGAHRRRVADSEWGQVTAGIERSYTVEKSSGF
ncbi:hypothetical protein B842_04605 [Corynebacterium humireducens NBRC 106098 = DSM 45392]|uniref:Phosphoesterase HXTX domain-containing protein n=1 Tax=Corynebacterium humireducens NBRC 106098 = DSM 45392 TaxID=1223515 RepID=A0A0B5DAN9_9CORY|nr:2'-5' RNA ligase family protein [Corynebacterium humireducens]AJE32774.1 hypothetical protein B842_04605 [Corynebacterium humireducens NBRC 106098 = DSM 45392]